LNSIGTFAFSDTALEAIEFPRAVEKIGANAFTQCKSLTSVSFEASSRLQLIEELVFAENNSLTQVRVPITATLAIRAFPGSCEVDHYSEEPGMWSDDDSDDEKPGMRSIDLSAWLISRGKYEHVGDVYHSTQIKLYREICPKRALSDRRLIGFKQFSPRSPFPSDARYDEAFNREVDGLIRLCHPCIVPFVGFSPVTDPQGAVIAIVYMPGGSLKTVLESKPEWWNNTAKCLWVMQLVSAMKFTHGSNVVHRDLKPGNLVFDANHNLYICDFGSSPLLLPSSSGQEKIDTPMYMSLEMIEEDYLNGVDVYSFVLILYEIITGKPGLSPDLGTFPIINRICNQGFRPEIPSEVLPWVGELMTKCWTDDPDDRPPFSTIERILQSHKFQILPGVDGDLLMRTFQDLCCQIGSLAP
jgi:serine/threonine protein kinase